MYIVECEVGSMFDVWNPSVVMFSCWPCGNAWPIFYSEAMAPDVLPMVDWPQHCPGVFEAMRIFRKPNVIASSPGVQDAVMPLVSTHSPYSSIEVSCKSYAKGRNKKKGPWRKAPHLLQTAALAASLHAWCWHRDKRATRATRQASAVRSLAVTHAKPYLKDAWDPRSIGIGSWGTFW